MAVKNQLAKTNNDGAITFEAGGESVKLSSNMIRKYLVQGNSAVTEEECVLFLSLCKYNHLNPFNRDCYLIKYGNSPAQMVVSKDLLLKRAMRSGVLKGIQSGVVVMSEKGEVVEREGTIVLPKETLIGAWAKVFVDGYSVPFYSSVNLSEYSTGKSNWLSKPAVMIKKCALAQALREAFPESMSHLYEQAEIKEAQVTESDKEIVLDETPVVMPSESPVVASEEVKVIEPSPVAEKPSKRNTSGQAGIEDIMFPDVLGGDMPTEI